MAQVDQTAEEVLESLTGFDEMAITQHFGKPISGLLEDQSMFGRALVFVVIRRGGVNDDDARNTALGMPFKTVLDYFVEENEGSGKGEPEPEPEPASSPTGA